VTIHPDVVAEARHGLRVAQQIVQLRVCSGSNKAAGNHWTRWRTFRASLTVNLLLPNISDPDDVLEIFVIMYR